MQIRSTLYSLAFLALVSALGSSQQSSSSTAPAADSQFGTVVVLNISDHRTGKIQIRESKRTLAKIGQHQWAELKLPSGEHVLTTHIDGQKVVLNLKPGETQYVTLNFHVLSYLPPIGDMNLQQVSEMEGQHWRREFGEAKHVTAGTAEAQSDH